MSERTPLGTEWPYAVRRNQLKITYYRGSGPGGQKKNKTSSACRILHLPTREMAVCEDSRKQGENRERAFHRLAVKLIPLMKQEILRKEGGENAVAVASATSIVRTYHAIRKTVKDHRVGSRRLFKYQPTLDGDLDPVIEALEEIKNERM